LVIDGNILQPGGFLADKNGIAALFQRRIADRVLNVLFGAAPQRPALGDFSVDVDLAVGGAANVDVAGAIAEFEANGPDMVKVRSKVLSVAEACRVKSENAAAKRTMPGKADL